MVNGENAIAWKGVYTWAWTDTNLFASCDSEDLIKVKIENNRIEVTNIMLWEGEIGNINIFVKPTTFCIENLPVQPNEEDQIIRKTII